MEEIQERKHFQVTPRMMLDLFNGARWAQFIAIFWFVFCGLFLLGSCCALGIMGNTIQEDIPFPTATIVMYLISALIAVVPNIFLFLFSKNILTAFRSGNQEIIEKGLSNLKWSFIAIGITIIFYIIFVLIIIILTMAAQLMTSI